MIWKAEALKPFFAKLPELEDENDRLGYIQEGNIPFDEDGEVANAVILSTLKTTRANGWWSWSITGKDGHPYFISLSWQGGSNCGALKAASLPLAPSRLRARIILFLFHAALYTETCTGVFVTGDLRGREGYVGLIPLIVVPGRYRQSIQLEDRLKRNFKSVTNLIYATITLQPPYDAEETEAALKTNIVRSQE